MQLLNIEPKVDANMIANINTNSTNLSRELCAIMEKTTIQAKELEIFLREQSSRELPSNIKNDYIRKRESITLSLEDELLNLTLDEDKITMEYDKMSLILEGELHDPTLVENNELAGEEGPSLQDKQVEKEHPKLIIENFLVEVEDFNFPIDSLTFGMEKDRQVSVIERPSIATSQVWINAKHGKMTLLVGEKKMEFDLHQSIPLTNEERRACMKIKSSFSPIKENAPMFLQEGAL